MKEWGNCVYKTADGNEVLTLDCLPILFNNIVQWALIFAGVAAVVIIIVSGMKMILSGGDPKEVDTARKSLTYAILGLVLILLSFMIIRIIGYVTGAECINQFGFNNCS